jgi:hypothetical protein
VNATAAANAAPTRGFAELKTQEAEIARQELGKYIGIEAASTVAWLRRLALVKGEWCLAVKSVIPGAPEYHDKPWHHFGPQIRTALHPMAEAVELIRGGAEEEAERIEKIVAGNAAALAQAEAEHNEAVRRAAEEQQRFDRELERDRGLYQGDRFEGLNPWAQAFYLLGCQVRVRDPALAADIRAVAKTIETRGQATPMPGFPRERWWEG